MEKRYRVRLYGKKDCDKCQRLKERLDSLLIEKEWEEFDKVYLDIETVDGLVSFVKVECLNPQRIPSFIVEKRNSENGEFELLLNPEALDSSKRMRPWRYIGLETDYSEKGRGLIKPEMVIDVLRRAKQS